MIRKKITQEIANIDRSLLSAILILILFGWIMSFSATAFYFESYIYFIKNTFVISVSLIAGFLVLFIPTFVIHKYAKLLFRITILLLILVFVPYIGHSVNNSSRWIDLGLMYFQPSELMKIAMIIMMAKRLSIENKHIHKPFVGFLVNLAIIFSGCIFIVLEPDYGATMIIALSAAAIIFAAGTNFKQIIMEISLVLAIVSVGIILNMNRFIRLTTFWQTDLWENSAQSVYQTKQAMIGIARGEWFGTGLGAGIQKYGLLPERHTDMIFAIIGEELGILGMLFVMAMIFYIIIKCLLIARKAIHKNKRFSSYIAFGFAVLFSLQTIINIAMNIALIPPKGFTLMLISYGGSSMLISVIALAIILRIDIENKLKFSKENKYV